MGIVPFREEVGAIFSEKGLLSQVEGFEYRREQQEMALHVAQALASGTHVAIEAGTGVGKSLAYLVPAVLHSTRERRRALLSTHTINLQEQLIYKDIPLVQKLLPVEFSAAILKGRQNYCCGTRLERAFANAKGLFTGAEVKELERIRKWTRTTKDGSLSDFGQQPDPAIWAQVCSERHVCIQKICGKNPYCFYQNARRRALSADILILNHTLFFTLLGGIDEDEEDNLEGYLFPGDFAIFDEAHTIESVAGRHVGIDISQYALRTNLHRLYHSRSKKGLFQLLRHASGVQEVSDLLPKVDAFFDAIAAQCSSQRGDREFRIRSPGIVAPEPIADGLSRLCGILTTAASNCEDSLIKLELQDTCRRLKQHRAALLDFIHQNLPDYVYWVERTGKRESFSTLSAVPVDLSAALGRLLFRANTPCVLTSATLSVGGAELDYFRQRLGAIRLSTHQIGSPFDYERQMKIFLVRKMPDPRDADYEAALEKWIAHFTEKSGGRAFVLFTAYQTLEALAKRMEPFFKKKGWPLLVQGGALPRLKMIHEFKRGPSAVLFGTDSFWSGVDVAGEALSNVIITRLPFASPHHPLTEAKLEAIEATGGDPFRNYSLPEAILKLRQGVGRLIRTKTDQGMIVLLDSRILTKPYGRTFLAALPKCPVEIIA
ncbi:MAG: ATP-dependent helicase [Verrucomicrobia bacterium]|nr:MAG: ATP-dependent helicase [Verrucomicrobiota bacterium]